MNDHSACPIWTTPASVEPQTDRDGVTVVSPRAGGLYFIAESATAMLQCRQESLKALLTSWLIEQRRLGVHCPEIFSTTIAQMEQQRRLSIHQRANNLLRYIQGTLSDIGSVFSFETHVSSIEDFQITSSTKRYQQMLAWSESSNVDELTFLVDFLENQFWLEKLPGGSTFLNYRVTVSGYSYLTEIDHILADSSKAFVAMWFDDSMDEVWENGLRPAINDTGYEAVRIDQKEHLNKIDDEIIAEIRRSRFLIADFTQGETGARGGVYYEAGFAHGLNIPVIFTCRKDSLDLIHFDTRQYPHIVWETPQQIARQPREPNLRCPWGWSPQELGIAPNFF